MTTPNKSRMASSNGKGPYHPPTTAPTTSCRRENKIMDVVGFEPGRASTIGATNRQYINYTTSSLLRNLLSFRAIIKINFFTWKLWQYVTKLGRNFRTKSFQARAASPRKRRSNEISNQCEKMKGPKIFGQSAEKVKNCQELII